MPNEGREWTVGGAGVRSSSEGPGQHYPPRSKSGQTAPAATSRVRERCAETPPAPPGLPGGFQLLSPARRLHPPAITTQPETPGIPSRGGFVLPGKLMVVVPPSHLPAPASTARRCFGLSFTPICPRWDERLGSDAVPSRIKPQGKAGAVLHNSETSQPAKKRRAWITGMTRSQHVAICNIPMGQQGAKELQAALPPSRSLGTVGTTLRPHVCSQRSPVGGIKGV